MPLLFMIIKKPAQITGFSWDCREMYTLHVKSSLHQLLLQMLQKSVFQELHIRGV